MAKTSEKFVPIYVDLTDGATPVAKQYGVGGIPDVRFLKPDGSAISKLVDRSPAGVVKQMEAALAASN